MKIIKCDACKVTMGKGAPLFKMEISVSDRDEKADYDLCHKCVLELNRILVGDEAASENSPFSQLAMKKGSSQIDMPLR